MNVCSGDATSLFLSLLSTLITYSNVINGVCQRVTPIPKPLGNYDFIVVGGKIIDVIAQRARFSCSILFDCRGIFAILRLNVNLSSDYISTIENERAKLIFV